jgi:hypothetical protein
MITGDRLLVNNWHGPLKMVKRFNTKFLKILVDAGCPKKFTSLENK